MLRDRRTLIFLAASFLSAVGDMLLVFAVPAGLGIETGDIRAAVLMWLVPAIAMFLSSFLNKKVAHRKHTVRQDYCYLLFGIAVLETIIACLALFLDTPVQTIILISAFVFFYAFAKEGIPRLLYLTAVYRFFVTDKSYTQIVGVNNGLNILAALIGISVAALLVENGNWRFALITDALTFMIFGGVIFFFGRDVQPESTISSSDQRELPQTSALRAIAVTVPLLFCINALIWNYLPLLSQKWGVSSVSTGILYIGFLRVPGLLTGFRIQAIAKLISLEKLVVYIPLAYISTSLLFVAVPNFVSLVCLILLQGLVSGIYWPADFSIRNKLSHVDQVKFNTHVLRRLAVFQFLACCAAWYIYSNPTPSSALIIFSFLGFAAFAIYTSRIDPKLLVPAVLVFALTISCTEKNHQMKVVVLPSISKNLELRSELTYAGMSIVNDTSAHIVTLAHDLTLKGDLLKKYESSVDSRQFVLELDSSYRSSRGEEIDADDVIFSFEHYLKNKRDLSGVYKSIFGAEDCNENKCSLKGVKKEDKFKISITLAKPDSQFIKKLSSPWLVILKRGKPIVEIIGDCRVPYQTGRAIITACDGKGITFEMNGQRRLVTSLAQTDDAGVSRLVMKNPGDKTNPTLTTLAAFANPNSRKLSESQRIAVITAIRKGSEKLAKGLRLRPSPLLIPQWLAVDAPREFTVQSDKSNKITCPKEALRILLDTSLPDFEKIKAEINEAVPCEIVYSVTNADTYFREFAKNDIGIAWFTPDFLDIYNIFQPFDCSGGDSCYFNWKDKELQMRIDLVREKSLDGIQDKENAIAVERILLKKGYAAPIAEMNWWIKTEAEYKPIHPAGLFQMRIGDFL